MNDEKRKILLVEDDSLIVEIYTTRFKEAGFEIESALDGESAIRKLKEKKFDLVLLDIVLPNLTGFEFLEKTKDKEKFKDLKVLVLSNLGQKADIDKAEGLGVIKYLIKAHYTPSEVVEEVKKILG